MKHYYLLLLSGCFSTATYSQQNTESGKPIPGLATFQPGDSIEKFTGLLSCAEAGQSKEVADLKGKLSCFGFRYLQAEKDAVEIGNVNFNATVLLTDSSKKIITINFLKTYFREDPAGPKNPAAADYNNLKIFLSRLLGVKGSKNKTPQEKHSGFTRGLVWIKDNKKYILREFNLEKRQQNVTGMLDLSLLIAE